MYWMLLCQAQTTYLFSVFVLFVHALTKLRRKKVHFYWWSWISISPLISNFFMVDAGVYGVFASVAWFGRFFKMAFLKYEICISQIFRIRLNYFNLCQLIQRLYNFNNKSMICSVHLLFRGWEWHFSRCFSFADDHWGCCCEICLRGLYVAGVCLCADLTLVAILADSAHVAGLTCIRLSIGTPSPLSHTLSYGTDHTWIN